MISLRSLARSLRTRDDGVALPTVFGLSIVMLVFIAGAMTVSTRGHRQDRQRRGRHRGTRRRVRRRRGVPEPARERLQLPEVRQPGRTVQPLERREPSACPTGTNANPAFGIGTTGSWANIPDKPEIDGTQVQSPGWFRYEVSNKDYQDKGILHLRSTGKVGDVTRSIVADLKQDGFIDYLYFTNYETTDPGYAANDVDGFTNCERYAYAAELCPRATPATAARSSSATPTSSRARCAATTSC